MRGGLALLALLAVLAAWTHQQLSGAVGTLSLRDDPQGQDGKPIVLSLVTVDARLADDRVRVLRGAQAIDVVGDAATWRVGDELTVGGRFSAERRAVVAAWVAPAPDRPAKKRLGLWGLAAWCVALPLTFRRVGARWAIRG